MLAQSAKYNSAFTTMFLCVIIYDFAFTTMSVVHEIIDLTFATMLLGVIDPHLAFLTIIQTVVHILLFISTKQNKRQSRESAFGRAS